MVEPSTCRGEAIWGADAAAWKGAREAAEKLSAAVAKQILVTDKTDRSDGMKPTHFLLYLNAETFVGEAGLRLAHELRVVRAAKEVPVVMVHENDPARNGFKTTPTENGIFNPM